MNCTCGSQQDYTCCCGLYIEGNQIAPLPEALMRSRYTAYTQANISYIKNTMKGKPLIGFDEVAAKHWADTVNWVGLTIVNTSIPHDELGSVEFIAKFIEGEKLKSIHEISEFRCDHGVWYYIGGNLQPTTNKGLSRNALCPCDSQKKFKNCHAKKR